MVVQEAIPTHYCSNNASQTTRKQIKIPNKEIIVSILPSIDYQMEKNDFVNNLEKKIYTELDRIN